MAYRTFSILAICLVILAGCGENGSTASPPFVLPAGGTGGTGNSGTGGVGGTGGVSGIGGSGGSQPACVTSLLCKNCPSGLLCDDNDDCFIGYVCIESGCDTNEGARIKHCVFGTGGACNTTIDCPPERECVDVPMEGKRCVKTTPGCNTDFDCMDGFSCESGSCADRRVPCGIDADCPKSHLCETTANASFCLRVHRTCVGEGDCAGIAPRCEDIDGDDTKECAGAFDPNAAPPVGCVNSMCSDSAAPVCEVSGAGSQTACGQFGLCLDGADCAAGFDCVGLWADGRKECVLSGGSCSNVTNCPPQQVCASPRGGGAPSCQVGFE